MQPALYKNHNWSSRNVLNGFAIFSILENKQAIPIHYHSPLSEQSMSCLISNFLEQFICRDLTFQVQYLLRAIGSASEYFYFNFLPKLLVLGSVVCENRAVWFFALHSGVFRMHPSKDIPTFDLLSMTSWFHDLRSLESQLFYFAEPAALAVVSLRIRKCLFRSYIDFFD